MGTCIHCLLQGDVPDVGWMEGKHLFAAYCGSLDGAPAGAAESGNVIAIDFGKAAPAPPGEPALSALEPFLNSNPHLGFVEWHDSEQGLVAVRETLRRLRDGSATVTLAPDFEFPIEDGENFTEGVIADLEELEKVLTAASERRIQFCLMFEL